uniref:Uncharacterized protein n=1 Tax=Anguilla anguilla TaxID=7936 RepID=A0A0E9TIR5_ANGAN
MICLKGRVNTPDTREWVGRIIYMPSPSRYAFSWRLVCPLLLLERHFF